jgi:hypothetical protein
MRNRLLATTLALLSASTFNRGNRGNRSGPES